MKLQTGSLSFFLSLNENYSFLWIGLGRTRWYVYERGEPANCIIHNLFFCVRNKNKAARYSVIIRYSVLLYTGANRLISTSQGSTSALKTLTSYRLCRVIFSQRLLYNFKRGYCYQFEKRRLFSNFQRRLQSDFERIEFCRI